MEKKWTMAIDVDRCIGCYACITSCKMENHLPVGYFYNWIIKTELYGEFPKLEFRYLYKLCMHCVNPPCLESCPTGALYKREDGILLMDNDKCDGCEGCVSACPYEVISYNREWKTLEKCTLCSHRIDQGMLPICVTACVTKALIFGDLNDPQSEISKFVKEKETLVPMPHLGIKPKICYKADSFFIKQRISQRL